MAETQRTFAQLQALLADNAEGDISAQDLRDMLQSLRADHGELSITAAAETSILATDTFYQVAGTFALSNAALVHNFSMGTNGRLQYDGPNERIFHCAASWSMIAAGNNKIFELAIAKNGVSIATGHISRKIATGADVGTGALHSLTSLETGDYLSLMVAGETDTTNFTMTHGNLFAMGMLM